MGSAIMTAIVEQKGGITTNPGEFSPSTSRPIQQISATYETSTPSRPIQQILEVATAVESSNPIEQQKGDTFNEVGASPDDCFIEQKGNTERSSSGQDSPIEQLIFVTSNLRENAIGDSQLVEQRILARDSVGDKPIEQVAKKSNTIEVEQFDFIDSIFPPCGSVKNPITTNILWNIKDFGFPFDIETLIFSVQGIQVQDRDSFSITSVANGAVLSYDPSENFSFDTLVQITLTIDDNADPPNTFFYRCSWNTVEDSRPPVITLDSPGCNAIGVDVTEPVVFSILDTGEGVDQSSIKFSIEGLPVCSGLEFDPITTVSGNGVTVTWTHPNEPFRFDSSVSVGIEATDLSPLENSALFVCCFQTEESEVPEFLNWDPEQCKTFVDNRTGLSFEVYGNIDGVDISELEVRIDNKLRKVFVRPRVLRSE